MRSSWGGCLLLVACGGSPVVGTWTTTTRVTVQSPAGESTPRDVTTLFEIEPAAWNFGGGCKVPLTFRGAVAELSMTNFTCTLQSTEGAPLAELGIWHAGELIAMKRARFEAVGSELFIDFLLRTPLDANDLDSGDIMEFKPIKGAQRVR